MKDQILFRDASIRPTEEMIAQELGAANSAYLGFIARLNDHDIQMDWRYYNDAKAWLGKGVYQWTTSRGTQKEINTFWLTIWDGYFKIGISFPERTREDALKLALSDEVQEMVRNSKTMGKLKSLSVAFDVQSDELFDDIYVLIDFKKRLK